MIAVMRMNDMRNRHTGIKTQKVPFKKQIGMLFQKQKGVRRNLACLKKRVAIKNLFCQKKQALTLTLTRRVCRKVQVQTVQKHVMCISVQDSTLTITLKLCEWCAFWEEGPQIKKKVFTKISRKCCKKPLKSKIKNCS
jgi:hypothetical protein